MQTLKTGYGLIEAPVWDAGQGLIFADTDKGGVYCLDAEGNISTVVQHRKGIGGAVRHIDGGLIVSGRNVAYKASPDSSTIVLMQNDPNAGIVGFNDITTDNKGRIYAGALGFLPTATPLAGVGGDTKSAPLFLIDLNGSKRIVYPEVKLTNGLGFSPDGSKLYHADSGDQTVYRYDVAKDGGLSNRSPFASVSHGLPDGMAISVDGSVWLAVAHGGKVIRYSADGKQLAEIVFPIPMITSLCFGGSDMRDLYVVSGSDGSGKPDAGSIYRLRVDVAGVEMTPSRVDVSTERAE